MITQRVKWQVGLALLHLSSLKKQTLCADGEAEDGSQFPTLDLAAAPQDEAIAHYQSVKDHSARGAVYLDDCKQDDASFYIRIRTELLTSTMEAAQPESIAGNLIRDAGFIWYKKRYSRPELRYHQQSKKLPEFSLCTFCMPTPIENYSAALHDANDGALSFFVERRCRDGCSETETPDHLYSGDRVIIG